MRTGSVLQDVRYALRSLWRAPGFAAVAILTLGLGIGANTAIFSVLNAVLFRPIPTEELDRLFVVREDLTALNLLDVPLAPPEVLDLVAREDLFRAVTGFREGNRTLTGYGDAARVVVATTLGDFAGVFGVRPHLGRFYGPQHSQEGPFELAVVSHGLWREISGGDPAFVGRTIELDGVAHEVVGVMDPEFRYPRGVQVWVPFPYTEQWQQPGARGRLFMHTIVRLQPGLTESQLAAQLDAEAARWNEQHHGGTERKVLHATGFVEHLAGPLRLILMVLMGAVIFVLLIAAANVCSLQLVRASARAKELAVRSAMGARRGRIAGHLFTESLILAAAGGAAGLWIGWLALGLFERWQPARQMYLTEIPLDGAVLGFITLVALVTAVAFGTIPALRASRVHPQDVLRESVRGASAGVDRHRLLQAMIVVQVGLTLMLLLGSGLMIRTLSQLLATDPGFDARDLTTAQISIPSNLYGPASARAAFFDGLLERTRALPGVESAALVWGLPFTDQIDSSHFDIVGRPAEPGEPERHAEARIVSDGYFATMRIPLLRGRAFDGTERSGEPVVAVIDQIFAEQFFPGEDPVGRRIVHYTGDSATVIGVARRVDHKELADAPKAIAYYSFNQQPWWMWRSLVVRSSQPTASIANMLRAAVIELDPNVPLYDVQTMESRIEASLGPRRLALLALGGFAVLSLLLATLGIYGVMRYTTTERTREIGIRMALGAEPGAVVSLVLRQVAVLLFAGLALGAAAALLATRAMQGMLFGVAPTDPLTYLGAALILAVAALLSSYLPARRASRVDPMFALRAE